MFKFLLILLAVLGEFITNTQAESPIDFSTSDNLKAVYDAGFRPWRSTMFSCIVTDKHISIILPENAQFSLPVQMATFSVLAGDQMSRTELYSEVMMTGEAIAEIREICSTLNLPITGLDQFAATFADPASKSTVWNTSGQKGQVSIFVSTDRLDFIDHLGAKVYVTLDWKRQGIPPKFPTTPMKPPVGYENVSMDPPKVNPNQKGFPEHDMQYYKDLIAKKKAEDGNSPAVVSPPPTQQTPTPVAPNSQVQPITETGLPIWGYGVGVIVLGVIVALWYRSRPK